MVNRSLAIGVGILIIVLLGFVFVSNMTGNVITGMAIADFDDEGDFKVENELFRIDDFGSGLNETEDKNDTQNNSGSR